MSSEQAAQIRRAQEEQKQDKATRLAEEHVKEETANQAQAVALMAAERDALRVSCRAMEGVLPLPLHS